MIQSLMMVTFVWYSKFPFLAGAGGTEVFTAGIIRELQKRGIPVQIATIGFGLQDGRTDFPDIPFLALDSADAVADLPGTVIFALDPPPSPRPYPAYFILHCPVWLYEEQGDEYRKALEGRRPIANSKFAAREWERFLGLPTHTIPVVYPFAPRIFSEIVIPPKKTGKIRVLFPNRLNVDKGIYTFMAALHFPALANDPRFEFTVTGAASHTPQGSIIRRLVEAHPKLTLVPPVKTAEDMAALMAQYDIIIVPSSADYWRETFGMTSVEAQKVGCRVVATSDSGLAETDCGGLTLIKPDSAVALAEGLLKTAKLGRLSKVKRRAAAKKFTVEQSVDQLLTAIDYKTSRPPK